MGYQSSQISIANSPPTVKSAQFFGNRLKQLDTFLFIETALVTTTVLLTIGLLATNSVNMAAWYAAPGILIAAALIPTVIKRCEFARIGLNIKQMGHSLVLLGWTCIVVFPALFCGLWLLKYWGLELPLQPVPPQRQTWASWLFYQFMYIAVAEEVFFRGYVQSNILRLTNIVKGTQCRLRQWISIGVSAAVFAVAHIIVQGQIISALTFLPGLFLGWLFIRTRSLLAPILFHGLANTCYCVMAAALP